MRERQGPIAGPGYRFILAGLLITMLGFWLGRPVIFLGLLLTAFFAYFFRDPERPIPTDPAAVIAPADGRVIAVAPRREEVFLQRPVQRVSIFMNIFDVHVNRAPVAGQVQGLHYQPGRYLAADRPEASDHNEQLAIHLRTPDGADVVMVQIAGLVARRIVSYLREGDAVAPGERLGLICFGSRVDLYLPEIYQIQVTVGQKVKAGSSILGRRS